MKSPGKSLDIQVMKTYAEYQQALRQFRRSLATSIRLRKISDRRLPQLRRHLASGGKCLAELGCGTGEFAARLSERTRRWVLGIDVNPEQMAFSSFDYRETGRFLFLDGPYRLLLGARADSLTWLSGSAEKTFLIMPFPQSDFEAEVALWLRLAAPEGELHVRTEAKEVKDRLKVPRPHQSIPFAPEAATLPSFHSRQVLGTGDPLYSFGIKLLP